MKKITFGLLALILTLTLNAQQEDMAKQQLQNWVQKQKTLIDLNAISRLDPFKICSDSYAWDTISGQFIQNGESVYTYQETGDLKKMTIESSMEEDGEAIDIKIEYFASFQDPEAFLNVGGDSILIYFGDGEGNYELFTKTINHFENERLQYSEEFLDFSAFGFPLGFVKSGETWYFYDANDFLVTEVTDEFDFSTFELVFSDSIVYENNGLGLPLVETGYQADFFTGLIEPYYKSEYQYVNQKYESQELNYSHDGVDWFKTNRSSWSYDGSNRVTLFLNEITADDGANWMNSRRDQYIYEYDLPFGLPSRQLSQEFVNNGWRNDMLQTFEDCTSGFEQVTEADLDAWFSGERLYLSTGWLGAPARVSLFDVSGRKLFEAGFDRLPESIQTGVQTEGIYIIMLESSEGMAVKKIFR